MVRQKKKKCVPEAHFPGGRGVVEWGTWQLQAVRSVASDGKCYQLPPDKENTANL